jgi:hypothetical protein
MCALTGQGEDYTVSQQGLIAGDRGYSFEYQGKVWWLFGDTRPTPTFNGQPNASDRYPGDPLGFDNDSIAHSAPMPPPAQPEPYCPQSRPARGLSACDEDQVCSVA